MRNAGRCSLCVSMHSDSVRHAARAVHTHGSGHGDDARNNPPERRITTHERTPHRGAEYCDALDGRLHRTARLQHGRKQIPGGTTVHQLLYATRATHKGVGQDRRAIPGRRPFRGHRTRAQIPTGAASSGRVGTQRRPERKRMEFVSARGDCRKWH